MVTTTLNAMLKFPKKMGGLRIPVRIGSFVTEAKTKTSLHNFCKYCKTQTNQDIVCRNEDCKHYIVKKDIDTESTYIFGEGDTKVVSKELIKKISETERIINIKGSLPKSDTIVTLGGSYILPREFKKEEDFDPDNDLEPFKAYRQLHSALTNGLDVFVEYKRKRFNIAVLRAVGSVIVRLVVPFQEAVRVMDEEVDVKVSREEKQESKNWIEALEKIDVGSVVDTYREHFEKIITGEIKPEPKKSKKKPSGKKVSFFLVSKDTLKQKEKLKVGGKNK
jgi:non-homologous end joining protein Ku